MITVSQPDREPMIPAPECYSEIGESCPFFAQCQLVFEQRFPPSVLRWLTLFPCFLLLPAAGERLNGLDMLLVAPLSNCLVKSRPGILTHPIRLLNLRSHKVQ